MAILPEPALSNDENRKRTKGCSRSKLWFESLTLRPRLENDACKQNYAGNGTHENPYVVAYLQDDGQDAMSFANGRKWTIALIQAMSFFAVTFGSSVYASGIPQIMQRFHVSNEVAILGLALYVLGFAIGPILWAPMSELYGRRLTFAISYTIYLAFTVAAPFAPNITALLLLRFFAGSFGSSAQTNPGAMIADMFSKEERGPVMAIFAACPFLGPALGPIVGGFVAETKGYRWILAVNAILSGVVWIAAMLVTCETYAPVILRSRAKALAQMTGNVYVSQLDAERPPRTLSKELSVSFARPWVFMFHEPIVLLTGLYISIIYATLYMFFAAIPIVFERTRRWSQGLGGLPFVGVAVGVCFGVLATGIDNKGYKRLTAAAAAAGRAVQPEARLRNAMVGSILLPIGLFLFAWTTYPSVHWIAPVIGATVFSCGLLMVFLSLISYLIDSYTLYAASALAANTILRSFFATAFPLFTSQMYAGLGDQWASSVPAFLVVGCLPVPFLFYKYGPQIRSKCKYAAQAGEMQGTMPRHHAALSGVDQSVSKFESA